MDIMGNPIGSAASTGNPADLYGYGMASGASGVGMDGAALPVGATADL